MAATRAAWATPENLQRVRDYHACGRGARWISIQIGVTPGTISGAMNRMNLMRHSDFINSPKMQDFWAGGVAPAWHTPEADNLFRTAWERGVRATEIQAFFDITIEQRRLARQRLGLAPRDPATSVKVRVPASLKAPRRKIVAPDEATQATTPAPEKVNRAFVDSSNRSKSPVFTVGSVNWAAVSKIKIEREPGQCCWPLTCGEPATGRWCERHGSLLGKKAS